MNLLALDSLPRRFWAKVDKNGPVPTACPELGPCWVWIAGLDSGGYGSLGLGAGKSERAHRASWFLSHGEWPTDGAYVLHRCDNRPCVNPAHLFLGSHAVNMADMGAKGRAPVSVHPGLGARNAARRTPASFQRGDEHWARRTPERMARGDRGGGPRGELQWCSKVTAAQVLEVRARYDAGESPTKTAADYGVTPSTIVKIGKRRSWRSVVPTKELRTGAGR